MYNGVKAMITAEKELANKNSAPAKVEAAQVEAPKAVPKVEAAKTVPVAVSVKAGPHLKKPEDITGLIEGSIQSKSSGEEEKKTEKKKKKKKEESKQRKEKVK